MLRWNRGRPAPRQVENLVVSHGLCVCVGVGVGMCPTVQQCFLWCPLAWQYPETHFMNKYSCKKICIVKEGNYVSPIQQALEAQVNTLSLQMEEANMQLVSSI